MATYSQQNRDSGILSWADEDRPREKLMHKGKSALSDAELLAILIGSGTKSLSAVDVGRLVIKAAHEDLNQLAKFSIKDLKQVKGIGEAKAITILSALELGRRRKNHKIADKPKITGSDIVYELVKPDLLDLDYEEFWVLLLNRANQVIKKVKISAGGVSGTVADPKLIFKYALDILASGIILVHNHPSGNLRPSQADIHLTNKIAQGGKLLDISVLDHLIFTNKSYFSFADEGMMR